MARKLSPYIPGEDQSRWLGDLYRFLMDTGTAPFVPVGGVLILPATVSSPSGYILCDGGILTQPLHSELIALLGSSTLPDYSGETLNGAAVNYYMRF